MEEAEGRAIGLAPLEGVESQTVYLEGALPGGLTAEGGRGGHAPHCTQAVSACDDSRCQLADFVSPPTGSGGGPRAGDHVFSHLPERRDGKRVAHVFVVSRISLGPTNRPTG